jgi:hypothetical protein
MVVETAVSVDRPLRANSLMRRLTTLFDHTAVGITGTLEARTEEDARRNASTVPSIGDPLYLLGGSPRAW